MSSCLATAQNSAAPLVRVTVRSRNNNRANNNANRWRARA